MSLLLQVPGKDREPGRFSHKVVDKQIERPRRGTHQTEHLRVKSPAFGMNADTDGEEEDLNSPNVDPAVIQTKIDSIQSDGDCSAYQVDVLKDYDQDIEHKKIINS